MSGILIIGSLLEASPALLAVVPAERMAAGGLPQPTHTGRPSGVPVAGG